MSVGVAVVGCGRWGPNHVRTLLGLPGVELRWVIDPDRAARERAQGLAPAIQTSGTLDPALDDPAVQAVVIAAPASTHAPLGIACLRAGRHVLVEKPMATDLAAATTMAAEARRVGRQLHVGHICVFMPGVQRIRELIRDGALGPLRVLDAERTSVPPAQPDVDVLWDLGTHDVSILNSWIGGEPLAVAASGEALAPYQRVSAATATLWYPGGVLGRIRVSWHGALKVRRASATGASAVGVFDDTLAGAPVTLFGTGQAPTALAVAGPPPLQAELQAFLDAVEGRRESLAGGPHGLAVIRVLTALERSLAQGGQRVALDAPRGLG